MGSRDFCYWLMGFFEISEATSLTEKQTQQIRNHLNMVFIHEIDPSFGDKPHQEKLNEAHSNIFNDLTDDVIKGKMRC